MGKNKQRIKDYTMFYYGRLVDWQIGRLVDWQEIPYQRTIINTPPEMVNVKLIIISSQRIPMDITKDSALRSDLLRRQQIISRQDIDRQYKQNVSLIYQTLTDLVDFSNQLGDKVDSLLQHQSVGFFNAYRSHLTTIQHNVAKLQNKIKAQQAKIQQYQSEGTIALLLKKISKIQQELSNLYQIRVKLLELQEEKIKNNVLKGENVKLGENIQEIIRRKSPQRWNTNPEIREREREGESKGVEKKESRKTMLLSNEFNKSVSIKDKRLSFNDAFVKDLADIEVKVLKNKIVNLTKEHNKLLKSNVEIGQLHNQLEGFFLECVESVKKDICTRKQTPVCKLSDFKKQDKMKLLVMVLENDQVVRAIYYKLFNTKQSHNRLLTMQSAEEVTPLKNKALSLYQCKTESKSTALPNIKPKHMKSLQRSLQSQ